MAGAAPWSVRPGCAGAIAPSRRRSPPRRPLGRLTRALAGRDVHRRGRSQDRGRRLTRARAETGERGASGRGDRASARLARGGLVIGPGLAPERRLRAASGTIAAKQPRPTGHCGDGAELRRDRRRSGLRLLPKRHCADGAGTLPDAVGERRGRRAIPPPAGRPARRARETPTSPPARSTSADRPRRFRPRSDPFGARHSRRARRAGQDA